MFKSFRLHKTWFLGAGRSLELSCQKEQAVADTTSPFSTRRQILQPLVEMLSELSLLPSLFGSKTGLKKS